jgi:hypothetical protein
MPHADICDQKACRHMDWRARTTKPAKSPNNGAHPGPSHQGRPQFHGKQGRCGIAKKAGRPRVNRCLCGDNMDSETTAQTFMLHAPPSPSCASARCEHPSILLLSVQKHFYNCCGKICTVLSSKNVRCRGPLRYEHYFFDVEKAVNVCTAGCRKRWEATEILSLWSAQLDKTLGRQHRQ